ncbi:MAG TPA: hypothetical protein DER60_14750 [Syntrophomonas sp.]|nr:hypothetical protein [Syntrophomonas sp.]
MKGVAWLTILLGILASLILATYSIYFLKIIRGYPQEFELELLDALQNWLQESNTKALWILLWASVLFEVVYFSLVFLAVSNPVTLALTGLIIVIEMWHLSVVFVNFRNFFGGRITCAGIFNWKLERISAMGFFTHSLIVLLTLLFLT